MHNPLVSVIIPNYCHAKYLDQRIQSVLDQTYQNFEIIILDDCSPDDGASRAVIEKYRSNPHVTHIEYNETNSGSTFKQWHKGFELAKGELIWIAESDDYCEKTLLEELVSAYNKYPNTVLAYSTVIYITDEGNVLNMPTKSEIRYLEGVNYIKKFMTVENFMRNASSGIFSKQAAMTISKEYSNYKAAGDYLFWIKIAECGRVAVLNKRLSYFRRHEGVVTNRKEIDGTSFMEIRAIMNYLQEKGYTSTLSRYFAKLHYTQLALNTPFIDEATRAKVFKVLQLPERLNYISRMIIIFHDKYIYFKKKLV